MAHPCSPSPSPPLPVGQESCQNPQWGVGSGVWTCMLCFPSPWNVPTQQPCRLHPHFPSQFLIYSQPASVKFDWAGTQGWQQTAPSIRFVSTLLHMSPTQTNVFTHN